MTTPQKEALKHLIIVFFYSAVSSILPLLIAYVQNDARWALLIPVINYGPQIDRLSMVPSDAAVLANKTADQVKADPAYNVFKPVLPVTVPLV